MTPTPSERVKNFPTLNYTYVLVPSEQNKAAAAHVMGKCIVAFEFHCWNFSRGPGSSVTSRLPHNLTAVRQVMVLAVLLLLYHFTDAIYVVYIHLYIYYVTATYLEHLHLKSFM